MGRRILIVEDDKHFASQLAELMEFQGLTPRMVHSGPDGIEAFRAHAADLVLLDVMLPNVHGIRVLEAIRTLPSGADVPVLLMSAVYRSEALFERDIKRLGVVGFLSKPFSLLDLGRRIDHILASPESGRADVRQLLEVHNAAPSAPPAAKPQTAATRSAVDVPSADFPKVRGPEPAAPPRTAAPAPPVPPSMSEIPAVMRQPAPSAEPLDSFLPAESGRRVPQSGAMDAEHYVRILTTLFHSHSSGRLILASGRGVRTVFLLNGYPIWVECSDAMDGLPRFLADEGVLRADRLEELRSWHQSRGGNIRKGLVELGLVRAAELPPLLESWVAAAVRDGLGHGGRFEFQPGDDFAGSKPVYEVNPIRSMCAGLEKHVPLSVAEGALTGLDERLLGRTRTFNRLFGYVASTSTLRNLGEFMLRPRSLSEIRASFGAEPETERVLWFLLNAGLVALSDSPRPARAPAGGRRPGRLRSVPGSPALKAPPRPQASLETRRIDRSVVDRMNEALGEPPTAKSAESAPDPNTAIIRDYVTRIDLDHYGFLGIEPDATAAEVDAAYQKLAPRYRLRNLGIEVQGDVRRQAKELLTRLVRTFDELSDPGRRAAYDEKLARAESTAAGSGGIPSLLPDDLPPELNEGAWYPGLGVRGYVERESERFGAVEGEKFRRAHKAMSQNETNAAYRLFDELRGRYPSDPAVLAALGWCRHAGSRADQRTLGKALEWVDLALAFQPEHDAALEARARMLADAGDERAHAAARRLARVQPNNPWAKQQVASRAQDDSSTTQTKSGVLRSLWGKRR